MIADGELVTRGTGNQICAWDDQTLRICSVRDEGKVEADEGDGTGRQGDGTGRE